MWLIFFLSLIQKMTFLFTLSTIKNNVLSRLQCSPLEGEQFIPCHPVYIESDGDKCSAVPLLNYEQGPPFENSNHSHVLGPIILIVSYFQWATTRLITSFHI